MNNSTAATLNPQPYPRGDDVRPRPNDDKVAGSGSALAVATRLRALVVEDSEADLEFLVRALRKGGFEPDIDVVQSAEDFADRVRKNRYEIVLADYGLPGWNGLETLEILRREGLDIPVVMVSGSMGEIKAVECIKQGAADYVLKDHLTRLPHAVRRAVADKQLRDEHRHSQEELARSNRDLEQFAYVASHDLQEPLRMVATYTQLLAERYRGKLDENADKYIHYAVDGALRMQTLVHDLLAFSRVGSHGTDLKLTDCNAVLEAALKNLHVAVQESGAQLIRSNLPSVLADSSQLAQVFQNLLGNAIKFRAAVPPVIRIRGELVVREWVFSIADNGIGIAPEQADIIFVIFKRLHTCTEYPGSGIGLAICKKIIEQHGGRIWVESEPGLGSTFKFTIPASGELEEIDFLE